MTYKTQATIAQDQGLVLRVAAALAGEGVQDPLSVAQGLMWRLAVVKGWDTAVETADVSTGRLGRMDVITDRMIRAAVRNHLEVAP